MQSDAASVARAIIGFCILVIAHFAVRPLFSTRVSVDFIVIAILFAAVRMRPGVAAILGLLAGLVVDSLTPMTFGAGMVAMTALAAAASWTRAVFFSDNIVLTGLFVLVGKWLFDVLFSLIGRGVGGLDLVVQLTVWSPISALLTTAMALMMLTLFRPFFRPQSA